MTSTPQQPNPANYELMSTDILIRYRIILVFLAYAVMGGTSYYLTFLVLYDFDIPESMFWLFTKSVIPIVVMKLVALYHFNLHRGLWRYASTSDLLSIFKACTLSTIFMVLWMAVIHPNQCRRAIFVVDWFAFVMILGGMRFGIRLFREMVHEANAQKSGRRTLIIGAGDNGEAALRSVLRSSQQRAFVVGFLDDDPAKSGMTLHGLSVLGTLADFAKVIAAKDVTHVVFAIPGASKKLLRNLVEQCALYKARLQIQPSMQDVSSGRINAGRLRDVRLEDLLGRDPIQLDHNPVAASLQGRCVLITGAGGSIGSELARQIATYSPVALSFSTSAKPRFSRSTANSVNATRNRTSLRSFATSSRPPGLSTSSPNSRPISSTMPPRTSTSPSWKPIRWRQCSTTWPVPTTSPAPPSAMASSAS